MSSTSEAVVRLVEAAAAAAERVSGVGLLPGLPYVSGWQFTAGSSGLRSARATLSVDLAELWRQRDRHPEIAAAKRDLVDVTMSQHPADLERLGMTLGGMPSKQVAQVLARQVLYRTAGHIDGSGRWQHDVAPSTQALPRLMAVEVDDCLRGAPTLVEVVAPLSYCDTELVAPVTLKQGLSLVPLDAGQVTRLLSGSMSSYSGVSPSGAHDWKVAVVATVQLGAPHAVDAAMLAIDDALVLLRLLRHTAVGLLHHFIRPRGLSLRERGSGVHLGTPTFGASLNVTAADVQSVVAFVAQGASSKEGRLALAIRRLVSAESRRSHEDRLIDYWVGLEALYGVGGTSEVSYRVGIRMAHALAIGEQPQRTLFKQVRDSYNLRSAVVHGDPQRAKKATAASADQAEAWLRESIRLWWQTTAGPTASDVDQQLFRSE